MNSKMTAYDRRAWSAIQEWKNPKQTWLSKYTDPIGRAVDAAAHFALDNQVGNVLTKALQGVVELINDGASWSVRTEAILAEFREDGHKNIRTFDDLQGLSLKEVDRTVGYLGTK
jgi:hypothetical protein